MLTPGTRIGPYEVSAQIGSGGMGEVYRATDTNLKRQVALKVLPESVAGDPERLARFQREAELLAALNHPNIAHIHGVERSGGITALVMELVDGPTLAEAIERRAGPSGRAGLPIDEALPIAKQIAEALEAAHEQGIIHRDLKPANVKVRPDGTVKVLDFGLAKAVEPTSGIMPSVSQSPTMTTPAMTQAGMILGTAAYMSPEQARGKPVDKRADIWAFGCVLYEMLTGRRAFGGDDVTDTIVELVSREPDWDALPPSTAAFVRALLRRCLVKDSKRRLRDMGEARLVLEGGSDAAAEVTTLAARRPLPRVWQRPIPVVLAFSAVAVASGLIVWALTRSQPPAGRLARFELALPPSAPLSLAGTDHDIAFSRDGSLVAYRATRGAQRFLAIRALDDLVPRTLQETTGPTEAPFFSPDGAWLGFSDEDDQALKRVSTLGGPAVRICTIGAGGISGATWGEDDTIVFAPTVAGGLKRCPAAGGEVEELTTLEEGQTGHAWPEMLPGARAVLFTVLRGGEEPEIAVLDLQTRVQKVLLSGGSYPKYSPTGHLVYGIDGVLRAVAFDVRRLEVVSAPVPVVDSIVTKGGGAADFALSGDGSLAYVSGGAAGTQRQLVWVDRAGREEPLPAPVRAYRSPRISPDGRRLALGIGDELWVWDFDRRTLTRLTFNPGEDENATWTPDNRQIIFGSERDGTVQANLYRQSADGTGSVERLTRSPNLQGPLAVTRDGNSLVFWESAPTTGVDLFVLPLAADTGGQREARALIQTPFRESDAEVSPDGRWLAYQSNESGGTEVYVRPFPNVESGRWQISNGGGQSPLWSPDGRELFWFSTDGISGVRVQSGSSWGASPAERVLEGSYFYPSGGFRRMYDIAPDGKRFLMIKDSADAANAPRLVVVQNFFEELKRLLPVQ